MKKISIIGATVIGNRGAEAMLSVTVGRISEKYPKCHFYIFSYLPKEDFKLLKERDNITVHSSTPLFLLLVLLPSSIIFFLLKWLNLNSLNQLIVPRSTNNLFSSDVLIDIAGVSFMDGRKIFLPFNILTILPAMLIGTPVVKFSQAIGPFKNNLISFASDIFLPKCKQIFVRGEISFKNIKNKLINQNNYQQASDLAFLFKKGDSLSVENSDYINNLLKIVKKEKSRSKNFIGLCPSSIIFQKSNLVGIDYINNISNLIIRISENKDLFLILFPNASNSLSSKKLRNNDLPIIDMIQKKLYSKGFNQERVLFVTKNINTDGVRSLISECDITIVSRFHAMIASISLSVPTLVIAWGHKYLEVMKSFNMENLVFDFKKQEYNLVESVINMIKDRIRYKSIISQKLPIIEEDARKQFNYIFREFYTNDSID